MAAYGQAAFREVENVQRRATKMLSHLKKCSYSERLHKLKLPSLEHRRLRGDIIETYKYLHGYYKTEKQNLERSDTNRLRGNSLKLKKQHQTKSPGKLLQQQNSQHIQPTRVYSNSTVN